MNRRDFVKTGLLAGASISLPHIARTNPLKPSGSPLNIVYVVVHDLGRHFQPYGVPVSTPNLQAFAEQGMTMDRAFCASPPCSPSRGCAMTGHYAHRNGLPGVVNYDWSLSHDQPNIVDVFNRNGYETVSAGFTHERHGGPVAMGYQKLLRFRQSMEDNFVENAVDDSIRYLRARKPGDSPFYLNCGTQEVHASLWAEKGPLTHLYNREELYGIDPREDVYIPPECPANEASYENLSRFQPCIRYMDHHIGRLFEAIAESPEADNTLVVITTDHGIYGSRGKGTIYDHGMEIGTIAVLPGRIAAGSRFGGLVNNLDFFQTFLDATEVSAPTNFGHSHWDGWTGKESYRPQEAIYIERNYHENYDPIRCVRTNDLKYIRNYHPFAKHYYTPEEIMNHERKKIRESWPCDLIAGPDYSAYSRRDWPNRAKEELYDLEKDPYETRNLIEDSSYAASRRRLSSLCDEWMLRTSDPLLEGPIPPTKSQFDRMNTRTGRTVGPSLASILGV